MRSQVIPRLRSIPILNSSNRLTLIDAVEEIVAAAVIISSVSTLKSTKFSLVLRSTNRYWGRDSPRSLLADTKRSVDLNLPGKAV